MEEKKNNVPLIVALSIPVLMIALIAVSIYLPAMFVKPTTNFIYSMGDYCSQNKYSVKIGKVIVGFALIGIGYFAFYLNKKYISQ